MRALLKEAVDSSLDHLRPWMPWAQFEPQTVEEKVELLRGFRGRFDLDQEYVYGVFARDESRLLGGSGLHRRADEGSLEIGYFIRADAIRQGLATEVTAVLTRVGFELCDLDRIDVKVDPENVPSLGVPRKLGFAEEARASRGVLPPKSRGRRDIATRSCSRCCARESRRSRRPPAFAVPRLRRRRRRR